MLVRISVDTGGVVLKWFSCLQLISDKDGGMVLIETESILSVIVILVATSIKGVTWCVFFSIYAILWHQIR